MFYIIFRQIYEVSSSRDAPGPDVWTLELIMELDQWPNANGWRGAELGHRELAGGCQFSVELYQLKYFVSLTIVL